MRYLIDCRGKSTKQSDMSGAYNSLSSSVPDSPELITSNSHEDSSPTLLERTPLQFRGKSRSVSGSHLLKRDLPYFSSDEQISRESSDDSSDDLELANRIPRWEADFRRYGGVPRHK